MKTGVAFLFQNFVPTTCPHGIGIRSSFVDCQNGQSSTTTRSRRLARLFRHEPVPNSSGIWVVRAEHLPLDAMSPVAGQLHDRSSDHCASSTGENPRRLTDLDQVAIGVADIATDLSSVVFRLRKERRPHG
jgi:hypothetical protein